MSKCKPKISSGTNILIEKGVEFQDVVERNAADNKENRKVVIKIPYDLLKEDFDVQQAFMHLVKIHVEEPNP